MDKKVMYSIGHGTRKIEDFLTLLKQYKIQYLIDVRSQPFSKFNPHFNQNDLKYYLKAHGITYVFLGDALGGRPQDLSCYDEDGKVNYEILKTKPFYLAGIKRLQVAYKKGIKVALMCSESKPSACHRSKLIGMTLAESDAKSKIFIEHIDERGKLKDQAVVMNELNKGVNYKDLFSEKANTTSRKSYV